MVCAFNKQIRIYLIFGKNPEHVNFCVWCKPETLGARGNDPSHESAVAQLVVQGLLVRPVGPLTNLPEVRVIF